MAGTLASLRIILGLDATGVGMGVAQAKGHLAGMSMAAGVAGLAITAAAIGSVKAAAQWESSFAGVKKTLDTTGLSVEQETAAFDELEGQLRDMALQIPINVNELASLAEAGGALGVAREDITEFTRVAALMGTTTNVAAIDAATALGKIGSVMPFTRAEYEQFGDVLVDLGNKGASTEAEIISMAQNFAGTAALAGLSKTELLGWSSAVANMGENAEAGGSSLMRLFSNVDKAVATTSPKLAGIADIAGLTASGFAEMYQNDPSGTLEKVVVGLSGMSDEARYAAYEILGINDIRVTRALNGLISNVDNITSSLDNAGEAAQGSGAMMTEAEKRFATAEAQFQLLGNTLNEIAITFGEALLPHLVNGVGIIRDIAQETARWMRENEGVVDTLAPIVTALAGLAALNLGAKMMLQLLPIRGAANLVGAELLKTIPPAERAGTAAGKGYGLMFKLAAVLGVAALAEALEEPLYGAADDINAAIFGDPAKLKAQGGAFAGTLADTIGDSIHEAVFQIYNNDPLISEVGKITARLMHHMVDGIDQVDPAELRAKVQGFIDAGMSSADAEAAGAAWIQSIVDGTVDAAANAWTPEAFEQGMSGWRAFGEALPNEAAAGIDSGIPEVVASAAAAQAAAIDRILNSGLGDEGAHVREKGRHLTELYALGLDDGQVRAVLAAEGIPAAVIDRLLGYRSGQEAREAGMAMISPYAAGVDEEFTKLQAELRMDVGEIASTLEGLGTAGEDGMDALRKSFRTEDTGKSMRELKEQLRDLRRFYRNNLGEMGPETLALWTQQYTNAESQLGALKLFVDKKAPVIAGTLPLELTKSMSDSERALVSLLNLHQGGFIDIKDSAVTNAGITGNALPKAFRRERRETLQEAGYTRREIKRILSNTAGFEEGGGAIVDTWSDGIVAALARAESRAIPLLSSIGDLFKGDSPPPKGPLRDIDKGGANVGRAWVDELLGEVGAAPARLDRDLSRVEAVLTRRPIFGENETGLHLNGSSGMVSGPAVHGGGSVPLIGNLTIHVPPGTTDPQAIGDAVAQRLGDFAGVARHLQQRRHEPVRAR